jgi:hypothetical protein
MTETILLGLNIFGIVLDAEEDYFSFRVRGMAARSVIKGWLSSKKI